MESEYSLVAKEAVALGWDVVRIRMILTSSVFDWITRVTDGQTHGRTDGRAIAYTRYSIYAVVRKKLPGSTGNLHCLCQVCFECVQYWWSYRHSTDFKMVAAIILNWVPVSIFVIWSFLDVDVSGIFQFRSMADLLSFVKKSTWRCPPSWIIACNTGQLVKSC